MKKKIDGKVSLTELGSAVAKQIPSIQFLFENHEYFKTHNLSALPKQFLQRIGDLQEFEMVCGKENTERLNTFFRDADEFVKLLTITNYPDLDVSTFSKLMKRNVKISHISDSDIVNSPSWQKLTKLRSEKSVQNVGFEEKIAANIPIILGTSDKSAWLAFLNPNGTIDVNNLMFSRNREFIVWCTDLFNYIWINN